MPATASSGTPVPAIPHPDARNRRAVWLEVLAGGLLLFGPIVLYAALCVVFLPMKPEADEQRVGFLPRLLVTFIPPLAYILWMAWRMDRAGYPKGRDLFQEKLFRKSIPHLVKAQRGGHPDAGRMLGDILLFGLGVEANPELAARYYRRAVADLDDKAKLLGVLDSVGNGSVLIAKTKKEIPADIPAWYRGMIDGLETHFFAIPEICSVLSFLYMRLGDIDAAVSYARRVPDREDSPNQRESLLEILPHPFNLPAGWKTESDSDLDETPGPGVAVGQLAIDRIKIAQVVACAVLVAGILWGMEYLIEPGLGRLAVMFPIPFACWWLARRIGRQDRFLIGEGYFKAERYGTAAKIFSRLSRESDPRADKRLGDMHLAGLGVDEDPARAVTAYTKAFADMELLEILAKPESPARMRRILAAINAGGGGDALAASMKQPLAVLADRGNVSAHSLLADIYKRLKDKGEEIEHARVAHRIKPEPKNEIRLAFALIDERNRPERVREGLEILERQRKGGAPFAISGLVWYHSGKLIASHKSAEQAMECYRDLRNVALEEGGGGIVAEKIYLIDSVFLLESFGPGVLTDEDIRMAAACGENMGRHRRGR